MTILEKIIARKKPLLAQQKKAVSIDRLKQSSYFNRLAISLKKALSQPGSSGVIAEFKRQSPSKPAINLTADLISVTAGYQKAGAAALSILTDTHFFGGRNTDILQVRKNIKIPILRKDFIFDPYQIYEAKSIGADAILLIAEILSATQIADFAALAKDLNLEVLMETHDEDNLEKITKDVDIVGVNNRNLKTFEVSLENSIRISEAIPDNKLKISESGIRSPQDINKLRAYGYQGFLIGEMFMKTSQPELTCQQFIQNI